MPRDDTRNLEVSLKISEIKDDRVEDVIQLWQQSNLLRAWNDPRRDIELARRTPTSSILVAKQDRHINASAVVGFEGTPRLDLLRLR
jgi:hypothetical protein